MDRRRRQAKKPKKPKSLRLRLFLFILFLLLASAAVYLIMALPIWKIQDVSVIGTRMLSAEEIKDLSGIPLSENLFLTSFARARENLRKIAAIRDFHIYRIPPGTVLIKVEERKPIAVVVDQGRSTIIDADGYILNRNPNLTLNVPYLTDLPVISGLAMGGEKIDPKAVHVLKDVLVELANIFGSRRTNLELGGMQNISFLLDDILRVKLGRDDDIARKMEVFKALLPEIEGRWQKVEYVDVRYPDDPVIRFK